MDFHPFDPDSGLIPEIADFGPLRERSGGRGIILIAVPDVETPSWCAQAAVALVTAWSARARIVLADASLGQPALHDIFGVPNSEGVTDLMVAGAQLRAVCRQIGSPGFLFISAGAPSPEPADVMRSGQWDIVFKTLKEADVTLVVYAPADLPGLDALLGRSSAVLLLGGDLEGADETIRTFGLSSAPQLGPGVPSRGTDSAEAAEVTEVVAMADAP